MDHAILHALSAAGCSQAQRLKNEALQPGLLFNEQQCIRVFSVATESERLLFTHGGKCLTAPVLSKTVQTHARCAARPKWCQPQASCPTNNSPHHWESRRIQWSLFSKKQRRESVSFLETVSRTYVIQTIDGFFLPFSTDAFVFTVHLCLGLKPKGLQLCKIASAFLSFLLSDVLLLFQNKSTHKQDVRVSSRWIKEGVRICNNSFQ